MKTVLFLPGFPESLASRDYASVLTAIEAAGYKTKFIPIKWNYNTIADWVAQLEGVYKQYDPKEIILAGFSYGAMTAFVTAAKQNPSELWLFSLSPYFAEDLPKLKPSWLKSIGKKRVTAFQQLSFQRLATQIHCKTLIFYGEKEGIEWQFVKDRAEATLKPMRNSRLTVVEGAHHDVADPRYIEAITEAVKHE